MASSSSSAAGAVPLPTTAELKNLTPYLQRAQELRTADPAMAYWCSLYAAQLGIGTKSTERESKLFLGKLMDDLEAQKKALGATDVITDETVSSAYVENFALKVFVAADNQDRAGKATKATARNFLVASQFLEVLNAFGPLETEIAEKVKYAKWKAADLAKAFKEGRTPVAGPPGGQDAETGAIAVTTPGETAAESDAVLAAFDAAPPSVPTAPPAIERASSTSSSATGGDNSARLRARLSIHAANPTSPNFSMPLPVPPKNALEAEVAAQQAELARLGLAPPDWRGSAISPPSGFASPAGSSGRPLPIPPQGGPARDGLPITPSGFPYAPGGPSRPESNASFSANASPRLGNGTNLPPTILPSTPSFLAGADPAAAGPPSVPLPPSSPSPYPYHQQGPGPGPGTGSVAGNSPLPQPPNAPPRQFTLLPSAPAPVPSAPPLPFSGGLAAPPGPAALPDSLTPTQTGKAQKAAKFAISALDYDDLATAASELRKALDIVEGRVK
ncbi:hypothetical protein V8E36_006707 [Tilletia maclaganii]